MCREVHIRRFRGCHFPCKFAPAQHSFARNLDHPATSIRFQSGEQLAGRGCFAVSGLSSGAATRRGRSRSFQTTGMTGLSSMSSLICSHASSSRTRNGDSSTCVGAGCAAYEVNDLALRVSRLHIVDATGFGLATSSSFAR